MAEYINRNELVGNLDKFAPEHLTPLIRTLIEKQPTADVVEVVRCGNCRHWIKTGYDPLLDMGYGYCYNDDSPFHCEGRPCTSEKYFCGSGERRTDDDTL